MHETLLNPAPGSDPPPPSVAPSGSVIDEALLILNEAEGKSIDQQLMARAKARELMQRDVVV